MVKKGMTGRAGMRLVLLTVLAFLAGCLGDPGGVQSSPLHADHAGDHGTMTKELGWLNYTTVLTAGVNEVGFEVKVPPGGAQNVKWSLGNAGPMVSNDQAYVTGPGCEKPAGQGTLAPSMSLGGMTFVGGACSDLKEGMYTFHVQVNGPTQGYKAVVEGDVTF